MESLEKGAIVSEVARRHGLRPQQLFSRRKQALKHVPVASFVPVVVDTALPTSPLAGAPIEWASTEIEIIVGAALIRIRGGADAKTLTAVLRAVGVG
jgi:transposase